MPLVNAKCTNCGGTLSVDASKEAAICNFCGSPFIVEKAIQNYNYNITNNITAQNVILSGTSDTEKERLLNNADTNLNFKEYNKAYDLYNEVAENYANDYRGWYGLLLAETAEFSYIDIDDFNFQNACSHYEKVMITAPENIQNEAGLYWEEYYKARNSFISKKTFEKNEKINQLRIITNESLSLQNETKKLSKRMSVKITIIVFFITIIVSTGILVFSQLSDEHVISIATDTLIGSALLGIPLFMIILSIILNNRTSKKLKIKNDRIEELNVSKGTLINEINSIKARYNI